VNLPCPSRRSKRTAVAGGWCSARRCRSRNRSSDIAAHRHGGGPDHAGRWCRPAANHAAAARRSCRQATCGRDLARRGVARRTRRWAPWWPGWTPVRRAAPRSSTRPPSCCAARRTRRSTGRFRPRPATAAWGLRTRTSRLRCGAWPIGTPRRCALRCTRDGR
jgi:hypothetical protein